MIAAIAAIVSLLGLCGVFSGAPDDASLLASIDPASAVRGLRFALSFGAGMPAGVATLAAIAVLVLPPVAVFLVVRWLLRRCGD